MTGTTTKRVNAASLSFGTIVDAWGGTWATAWSTAWTNSYSYPEGATKRVQETPQTTVS